MDIDLLSKMVKELILDNDRVVLPGLGSFVAEIVPSTFSDKGYTINPPYRRLFFRSKPDEGEKLVRFYAESNNVEIDIAERIIKDFVAELKSVLHTKKTVIFPGLGRLRATKENNIFFVADEDLEIYPAGFGLEPISLKTHVETPQEVAAVVEGLKEIIDEPLDIALEEEIVPTEWADAEVQAEQEILQEQEIRQESADQPLAETLVPEPVQEEAPVETQSPTAMPNPEPAPTTSSEPANKPVEAPEPVSKSEEVTAPVPVSKPVEVPESEGSKSGKVLKAVLITLALLVALLAVYVVVMRMFPDLLNGLLYSPEELEIINFK